jgi:hypothetical protein
VVARQATVPLAIRNSKAIRGAPELSPGPRRTKTAVFEPEAGSVFFALGWLSAIASFPCDRPLSKPEGLGERKVTRQITYADVILSDSFGRSTIIGALVNIPTTFEVAYHFGKRRLMSRQWFP